MNIIGRVLKWGIDRPKCCFFPREHDDSQWLRTKLESSQSWEKPNIWHRSFFKSCCDLRRGPESRPCCLVPPFAQEYPCMAQLGDELCACPDWTPLEPRFRSRGRSLKELVSLPEAGNMDDLLLLGWLIQRRTHTHTKKTVFGIVNFVCLVSLHLRWNGNFMNIHKQS